MTYVFQQFSKAADQPCSLVSSRRRSWVAGLGSQRHEGFWRDGPEDRKKKQKKPKKTPQRSQMTSCDLIQFSITVSSNHRERRERMKGRQRRRWTNEGIFFFLEGGGHNTTRMCVKCNKVGDWASGRLSAFSRRCKSHWCASPVRGLTCLYSCGLFYPARRLTTGVTNHTPWVRQNSFIFLTVAAASPELMKWLIQRESASLLLPKHRSAGGGDKHAEKLSHRGIFICLRGTSAACLRTH